MDVSTGRRPLKTRSAAWAKGLAAALVARGISPNHISIAGIGIAAIGALAMLAGGRGWLWPSIAFFIGAVCIQFRLLCNMLDGLVAVEGGKKSSTGDFFNEVPDRIEDVLFLAAAGQACGHSDLGWLCAVLAVSTAYIRAFGASLGKGQDFSGPCAKPHRMFFLTLGCLGTVFCAIFNLAVPFLYWSLILIAVLTTATVVRRGLKLYRQM